MRVIWKYRLQRPGEGWTRSIEMPDAQILSVQMQSGWICIWATVNPKIKRTEMRRFEVLATGDSVGPGRVHVATIQGGHYVRHVFEVSPGRVKHVDGLP